jgi:type I restriction enzyme S subunit
VRLPPYPLYKPSGVEWLGNVPDHWEVKRLKTSAACWVSNVDKVPSDDELPVRLCNYTDVYYNDHITPDMELMETTATAEEIRRFGLREGDVVITKDSEEWSDIAVPALVTKTSPDLVCGYHLAIVRSRKNVLSGDYLLRAFQSCAINQQFQVAASGVTRYGLPKAAIGDAWIPIPTPAEQQAIAEFLNLEIGRIDNLIGRKRGLIERLTEKRSALISRTVARGLAPATARAAGFPEKSALKPSGLDSLGDIPAHWNVLPFTKYVDEKADYRGKTPEKQPDGVFLVTAKNVRMGFIDYDSSQEFVAEEDYDEIMRRGLPKKGDILFTTEAPLGNVALVDREDIALAQRIIRFRMNPVHFDSKFTLFAMMSDHFQVQLKSLSTGSTAEGLKASKLPALRLVAPPIREQAAIASYLDKETAKLDALVSKVEGAIERLQEYRTALITAAVTGKIDVRKAAA